MKEPKRWRVTWMEERSVIVEAEDYEQATHRAMEADRAVVDSGNVTDIEAEELGD